MGKNKVYWWRYYISGHLKFTINYHIIMDNKKNNKKQWKKSKKVLTMKWVCDNIIEYREWGTRAQRKANKL